MDQVESWTKLDNTEKIVKLDKIENWWTNLKGWTNGKGKQNKNVEARSMIALKNYKSGIRNRT